MIAYFIVDEIWFDYKNNTLNTKTTTIIQEWRLL